MPIEECVSAGHGQTRQEAWGEELDRIAYGHFAKVGEPAIMGIAH
jgi:hypothetical protein